MREALIDSVNSVAPAVGVIAEEAIARHFLLMLDMLLHSVHQDHVVNPLERVSRDPAVLLKEPEIVLEGTLPIQFLVLVCVLQIRYRAQNVYGISLIMHIFHPVSLAPSYQYTNRKTP